MSESFSRFVEQLEAVLDSNPRDVLQFAIELRDSVLQKMNSHLYSMQFALGT